MRSKPITKDIKIKKHKFKLEIYPALITWEIFPYDYDAALYAFSNKQKIKSFVEKIITYSKINSLSKKRKLMQKFRTNYIEITKIFSLYTILNLKTHH